MLAATPVAVQTAPGGRSAVGSTMIDVTLFCGNAGANATFPAPQLSVMPPPAIFTASENWMVTFVDRGMLVAPLAGAILVTVGAARSMVQLADAFEILLNVSVAFTVKVCGPTESPIYDCGDVHGTYDPESSLHSVD